MMYTLGYGRLHRLPYRDAVQSASGMWFSEDEDFMDLDDCVLQMSTPPHRKQARGDVLELLRRALSEPNMTAEELDAIRYSFSISGRHNQHLELDDRAYLDMLLAKLEVVFGAGL